MGESFAMSFVMFSCLLCLGSMSSRERCVCSVLGQTLERVGLWLERVSGRRRSVLRPVARGIKCKSTRRDEGANALINFILLGAGRYSFREVGGGLGTS